MENQKNTKGFSVDFDYKKWKKMPPPFWGRH